MAASPTAHPRRAALAAALLALASAAGAQVRVGAHDCARGVRLVVDDVAKSEVLRQLAQAWNFKLDIGVEPMAPVRIDAVGRPDELVARLLDSESFMLLRQPDPRCPGQSTIARLFVVGPAPAGAAPPRRPPAAPVPTAEAVELTDAYLRSHGIARP